MIDLYDRIKNSINGWSYKTQLYKETKVISIIHNIESGNYKSIKKQINLNEFNFGDIGIKINDIYDLIVYMGVVKNSKLKYPIILDAKGCLIDGRHRIVKAILGGKKQISAIQLLDEYDF